MIVGNRGDIINNCKEDNKKEKTMETIKANIIETTTKKCCNTYILLGLCTIINIGLTIYTINTFISNF